MTRWFGRQTPLRLLTAVISSTAALVLLAWLALPSYRPKLLPGEVYGIDVSHHQGEIDWHRVAQDDVAFAYIKATEGGTHVDRQFDRNWSGAHDAGLRRGAYHFFTLCRSGQEQATNFLSVVPVGQPMLPPAVDLELAGNCKTRPPQKAVYAELQTFLGQVEKATGRDAVLYVGPRFERLYEVEATFERRQWRLRFLLRPKSSAVAIWQVMGYARVAGIEGRADLNVADLSRLARNAEPFDARIAPLDPKSTR